MFCGSGGVGKTSVAAAAALGAGEPARRQGARAHDRPGQAPRDRARPRRHRQPRAPGAARGAEGGGRRAARRAVGRDARHQAVVGRPRAAARQGRRDRVPHPREPAVPQPHRAVRAEPRLHRDGAALRDPLERRVRPDRHRHAADAQRDRLPRSARRAWPSSSAAGCCAGSRCRTASAASAAAACCQRREPALLPDGRPRPRQQVPRGHRRVLPATSSRCTTASSTRANAVEALLHDRRTTFAVVTTLEAAPLHEAERFCEELVARDFHLGALVLNKTLPDYLLDPGRCDRGDRVRRRRRPRSPRTSSALGDPALADPTRVARVSCARSASRSATSPSSRCGKRSCAPSSRGCPTSSLRVPNFEVDIGDVDGLAAIGRYLFGDDRDAA